MHVCSQVPVINKQRKESHYKILALKLTLVKKHKVNLS